MDVFSIIKKAKNNKLQKPLALFAVALFALLFSSLTFAGAASTPDSTTLFYLPSASSILNPNTSVHVLYQLFGPLIDSVLGASSTSDPSEFLFALMLMHWNYILITGCAMFFIYHLILGVFKSAEHGMFMGRDGDKSGTIFRVVLGPFIMVPAIKGGFCAAQYAIMTLILCGVHLANYVWSKTTDDIRMGATQLYQNGITSTLNNVAAELYEYSVLDSILSSGDMSIGKTGITSHSSGIVLLQNYPSFESVAHALMNSGAYLQKGQKADASSYQTGEWVLSGVEFTSGVAGYNPDNSQSILSSGQFVDIVLSGAGVPSVDPTYNTDMQVNPSGEHGENSQEKALIAPLGFDLMSIPQNWLIPILAQGHSSLYFASQDSDYSDHKPYLHFNEHLPLYKKYKSYNPGKFDCRTLIGTSSTQGYQMVGYSSDTESLVKGVTFNDLDQEYKACLIYQLVNVLARTSVSTGSDEPIWKLTNVDTNLKSDLAANNMKPPFMYDSSDSPWTKQPYYEPKNDCVEPYGNEDSTDNSPSHCQHSGNSTWYVYHDSPSDDIPTYANNEFTALKAAIANGPISGSTSVGAGTWKLPLPDKNKFYNVKLIGYSDTCDWETNWSKSAGSACQLLHNGGGSKGNSWYMRINYEVQEVLPSNLKNPYGLSGLNIDKDNGTCSDSSVLNANNFVTFWYYDTIAWQARNLLTLLNEQYLGTSVGTSMSDASKNFFNKLNIWPYNINVSSTMWGNDSASGYNGPNNFVKGLADGGYSQGFVEALEKYQGVSGLGNRCNTLINLIKSTDQQTGGYTNAKGKKFFEAVQQCLGYSKNLSLFNNNMDMGQLLKNQGRPNYPESGQLQVYYPISSGLKMIKKYAQGLLSGTSTVNITSSGFDTAVDSGAGALKTASGASSAIANLLDLKGWVNKTNGNQAASVDWGPFVRAVLAAAAPKLDSGSSQMYVPGSGFYQTDTRGFLTSSDSKGPNPEVWSGDTSTGTANAIMGVTSGAHIDCKKGPGLCDDGTGWMIYPTRGQNGGVPLGIPQCGPAYSTEKDMQSNTNGVTTGVIEPFNLCSKLTSGMLETFSSNTIKATNNYNSGFKFLPLTSFFGGSGSDVSWWNVGRSYLVLNQQLAANVQALVNRINTLLSGAKISTALNNVMQPFTSGGFKVTQSQKLKYDIQMSGGIQGTLHLTYRPASEVIPGMQSAGSEGSLTQPLSKNFLMLAVQNKDFVTTGTANNDNKLPKTNGLDSDPLVNHLNSLPDNLLKPFEYLALYYRIKNNGSNYTQKLKPDVQKSMLKHMNDMVSALKNNGLISDDAAKSSDTQAKMFSSIGSALSSVYEHITPDQVGGGSLTYINPLQIENVLQRLYSFGGASGESGSASGMVGKQYDFLTQIQQIGTTMIGDVIGNLYDIGDTYTATFNNNMALIDGNMTDVNNQYEQIKQATNTAMSKFGQAPASKDYDTISSTEFPAVAGTAGALSTIGLVV